MITDRRTTPCTRAFFANGGYTGSTLVTICRAITLPAMETEGSAAACLRGGGGGGIDPSIPPRAPPVAPPGTPPGTPPTTPVTVPALLGGHFWSKRATASTKSVLQDR